MFEVCLLRCTGKAIGQQGNAEIDIQFVRQGNYETHGDLHNDSAAHCLYGQRLVRACQTCGHCGFGLMCPGQPSCVTGSSASKCVYALTDAFPSDFHVPSAGVQAPGDRTPVRGRARTDIYG
jgi:hypothetical protein